MLRIVICAGTVLVVGIALLLFDDVQQALPIVNIAIWSVLIIAGLLVLVRAHRRKRRREERAHRARMSSPPPYPVSSNPRLISRRSGSELPRR